MERNKLKLPPIKSTKGDRRRNEDLQEETDLLSRSYPTMKLNIRKNDTNLGMLLPPLQNPELTKPQMIGLRKKTSNLATSSLRLLPSLATRHSNIKTTCPINLAETSIVKAHFQRHDSDREQCTNKSYSKVIFYLTKCLAINFIFSF